MGYHIIQDHEKIGWTDEPFDAPEGMTFIADDKALVASIASLREQKITSIKNWASEQLNKSAWRVQRAQERNTLSVAGESPLQVLAEREAIRRASNRAENEINALKNNKEIGAYQVTVKDDDHPQHYPLTQVQFLRRFTDAERLQINALREQSPQIDDYFHLLELAKLVNLADPTLNAGLHLIEQMGIIAPGRADEILEITT